MADLYNQIVKAQMEIPETSEPGGEDEDLRQAHQQAVELWQSHTITKEFLQVIETKIVNLTCQLSLLVGSEEENYRIHAKLGAIKELQTLLNYGNRTT